MCQKYGDYKKYKYIPEERRTENIDRTGGELNEAVKKIGRGKINPDYCSP